MGSEIKKPVCHHLVITVHGIRTFGDWQSRLQALLNGTGTPGMSVVNYRYGYFSVIGFLIPLLRWLVVRDFRAALLREIQAHGYPARVDLVAHSFGTHLVAWGLIGIRKEQRPNVHTIVLAGSVLKVGFSWRVLMGDNKLQRVINECGIRDTVLVFNQLFVLFTGMAGRVGFNGMEDGKQFLNRYYAFGHSGYFDGDDFMRQRWLPLLLFDDPPIRFDRPRPTTLEGVFIFLLNNAEPVKGALYAAPFLLLTLWVNGMRREAATQAAIAAAAELDANQNAQRANATRVVAERRLAESYSDRGLRLCDEGEAGRGALWLARGLEILLSSRTTLLAARPNYEHSESDAAADPEHAIRSNLGAWRQYITSLKMPLQHQRQVTAVAFSPDGKTILTGCYDNTARLWDAATGKPIGKPLQHPYKVLAVAYSPDGKTVLTGCFDGTVRVWDAATGKLLIAPFQHQDAVYAVAYSPDGRTVLTGGRDMARPSGVARLWDAMTGEPIGTAFRHQDLVYAVAYSPDGKTVLTGSGVTSRARNEELRGEARLWDAATGRPIGEPLQHQGAVYAVAFSPDGKRFLTGSGDRTARLWDVATGKPIGAPLRHYGDVRAVAHSPDGKTLLTGSVEGKARLWDAATGKPIGAVLEHPASVDAVAYSPDSKTILTGCYDNTARLWDTAAGKPIGTLLRHPPRVYAVAYSPDSKTVVTGSGSVSSGEAQLWDAATGKPIGEPLRHEGDVQAVTYSPDGKTVLTGCGGPMGGLSRSGEARLWDVATGRPIGEPLRHEGDVHAVTYSPDGKTVLTLSLVDFAGGSEIRLWDTATHKLIGEPFRYKGDVHAATYSPDGKTVLTGGSRPGGFGERSGEARLWDVATGRPIGAPLEHQRDVYAVAFSPDGKTILTGCYDNTARLWDTATGKQIGGALLNQGIVHAVTFSPDGKTALTGSRGPGGFGGRSGEARLWDVATGRPIGAALEHQDDVWGVAFGPDGKTVLTGSEDATARLRPSPVPVEGEPKRITSWMQVLTNLELDGGDAVHVLRVDEWLERKHRLETLGGPPVTSNQLPRTSVGKQAVELP